MTDTYDRWRAELNGQEPERQNVDTDIDGFWRIVGAKTKPDYPVAIWGNGLNLRIGNRDIMGGSEGWHEFIGASWLHCVAVTKLEYDQARLNGRWSDGKPARQMDEAEKLGIDVSTGGNNPPIEESLADQIKSLAATLDATPEPVDQDAANKLSGNLEKMRGLLKLAEAERVTEKEPWLTGEREVEAKWKAVKAPGEQAGIAAEARRKNYLRKEQARLDAEAAAERKRLQAEADRENERIRAENAAKLAEAEKEGGQPIEEGELASEVAAPVVEAPRAVAGGAFGRASGLRKVKVAVVEKPEELAMHFIKTNDGDFSDYLQKRAAAALRGKILLPGCISREELQ